MSRRGLFKLGGAAAAGLALSGCAIPGLAKIITPDEAKAEAKDFWPKQKPTGRLNFANWASYIDPDHETLKLFTKATGIGVNYQEVIEDDNSFFAKIDPILRSGQYSGYDLMVITDGFEFTNLVELQEVIPLDHGMLPNFKKYALSKFMQETFDPGNLYSVPWASGITGIAWNTKYVKEPITSIERPVEPQVRGQDRHDAGPAGAGELRVVQGRHRPGQVHARRTGTRPPRSWTSSGTTGSSARTTTSPT